jgi:hypothetical protein
MSRIIRPRRIALCAVAVALTTASVAPSREPAVDRLESLNRALARESGWTAGFDQEFTPVGMTIGEEATGRVWLSWPDRALFHTGEPVRQMMGLSGRTVRLIDLEDETCDERVLTDREWERIPLAAVLDPRGALVHFDVADDGERGIVLIPREPGGVDRVEVVLGDDGLPLEITIRDPQGAVNRLGFSGWERAEGPPLRLWLPTPPDGVECVADPGALD